MNPAPGNTGHTSGVAIDLLHELRAVGVTLTPAIDFDGPADAMTDTTLGRIRQHKPALLRLLVNPYRHTCIEHPERQKACDLLADAYDRDPLACIELAKRWYDAYTVDGDAAACVALQREAASLVPVCLPLESP